MKQGYKLINSKYGVTKAQVKDWATKLSKRFPCKKITRCVPKLNAITALWTLTAMDIDIRSDFSSCKPIANP